jgi:hypothetical protein
MSPWPEWLRRSLQNCFMQVQLLSGTPLLSRNNMDFPRDEKGNIDWEANRKQNDERAKDPKIGDYWSEMMHPTVVVVARPSPDTVLVCRDTVNSGPSRWTWNLLSCKVETVETFNKSLRYNKEDENSKCHSDCNPEFMKWVHEAAKIVLFGK